MVLDKSRIDWYFLGGEKSPESAGRLMVMLLVFLFPAMFFIAVGVFAYKWNKAVKAGIFQKGTLKAVLTKKIK